LTIKQKYAISGVVKKLTTLRKSGSRYVFGRLKYKYGKK